MKKNIKFMIGIVVGIVIGAASGIGVYATLTYNAGDIAYTKSGASTPISVSSALNELYQNKKETTNDVKNVTANGSITLDKYYKNLNVNVPIPAGYIQPSGTKTITTKANNIDVSNYQYADTTGLYTINEVQTGKGVTWNYGDFNTGTGTKAVNTGFRPTEIYLEWSSGTYIYLYHYNNNKLITVGYNGTDYSYLDVTDMIEINQNGFRVKGWGENNTITYIAR